MLRSASRAAASALVLWALALPANAESVGDSMVSYLQGKVGSRVGGGESWHLAAEALRMGGGEFVAEDLGADFPCSGDRVWGTLVTAIVCYDQWYDSHPGAAVLPGDVIQYGHAKFGNVNFDCTHTSVVRAVNDDAASRPTQVFQQKSSGSGKVQIANLDVTQLTWGWLLIYRPVAREDAPNVWKFAVVNNASTAQNYSVLIDIDPECTPTLTAAGTSGSYLAHKVVTDGTVPAVVLSNGQSLYVETQKANELFDSSSYVDIRQLPE